MSIRVAAILFALLSVSCSSAEPSDTAGPTPSPAASASPSQPTPLPTFGHAKVLIDTDEGSVLVNVEKAETPEQRAVGLMHRESLPQDAGMLFVFFGDATGGFYMKNTLIPLSIAFIDSRGMIVEILDMEPCEVEPCEIYDPGVPYEAALEVNQGAFEGWGVEEGDRVTVTH